MIEVRHDRALYLPQGDLWLDPRLPKPLAFVSHAHSDHTGRHEKTIATPTTLRLMQARMGEWDGEKIALPFGESRDFENFRRRREVNPRPSRDPASDPADSLVRA